MNETAQLIELLKQKAPLVAMLAPSFPVVYEYPTIVGKLKRLGFTYVFEVAVGAKKTNEAMLAALQKNPHSRFITSPCPSFIRLVRGKYPPLLKYVALNIDSPMVATARLIKERFPGVRPVFIGPCIAKKFEASEDHPELNILVLTYKEMAEVFTHFNLFNDPADQKAGFDLEQPQTRLYPISGGLSQSSQAQALLSEDELSVVSGWQNCEEALRHFEKKTNIRLLDILFCEGGCINGPGIVSQLSLGERRKKVVAFWEKGKK